MTNYSGVKYELTEALWQLQTLNEELSDSACSLYSEVDYWVSSIELLRQCLVNATDKYAGDIDLIQAINEIKGEVCNAYSIKYKILDHIQQDRLRFAWLRLEKAEGLLKE